MSASDGEAARRLLAAGWRQCTLCVPPQGFRIDPSITIDPATERLIVCTQSCSVCSPRFNVDPRVEVAVVKLEPRYHERSPEAKGSNFRKLMLPIEGSAAIQAIVCDVNRRAFVDRRALLGWQPDPVLRVGDRARDMFQGWLARYYIRIAMPDTLVARMKMAGIHAQVKTVLEAALDGEPLHASVPGIYVRWSPNDELDDGQYYDVSILFACDDEDTVRRIDEALETTMNALKSPGPHGILLKSFEVATTDGVTLKQANQYKRLTEWDELTELGTVASQHVDALMSGRLEP